jgi:hypothetical protein
MVRYSKSYALAAFEEELEKIEVGTVKKFENTLKVKTQWNGNKTFLHSFTIWKSFKINAHTRIPTSSCRPSHPFLR